MSKYIFNITVCMLMLLVSSCESKLDIVPKGKVTLATVDELELLLNQEYSLPMVPGEDLGLVCGETVGMFDQISAVMSQTNTSKYAYMAFDESVDRATLATEDIRYNALYKYINYMNVIITTIDDATGDARIKPQIKAEARVMRAYLHWLAVGIHAKQYDASTAEKEGGIAYCTTTKVMEQRDKLTLAQSYEAILNDLDDEEVLANMPDNRGSNVFRGDKAWGYAVKAVVLMQMKRYADALPYAQKAIQLRPDMFDRSIIKTTGVWTQEHDSKNNFLYINAGIRVSPTMTMLSKETAKMFEEGDYVCSYGSGWDANLGESYSGMKGVLIYMGWSCIVNVYGLTSEQLHYVAAECLIRTGKVNEGLRLVDEVRSMRVENAPKWEGTVSSEADAMALLQRAKWIECINTPFNYLDMKRWNTESTYRRTVTRNLGSYGTVSLSPESPLWVMPFPLKAVMYNGTLKQNY